MGNCCRDYFFPRTSIQKVYMGLSTGVYFSGTTIRTSDRLGSFRTGSTGPHFTSSPPLSPTKEPLGSSLQQDIQPSFAHPATLPHLLGTNALRCASVDSHGSNALHCCTSSSCSTCPTIPGAHATIFESRTYIYLFFFFPCRQQALAHLLTV